MKNRKRQPGMTLTELLVVMAVIAILLGISVPTAQHLMDSFESSTGVRHLINAALSNAHAIAVRNQAYAGVRFQEGTDGYTYMIFIIHDKDGTGLANGFRAVQGRKPMKLPEDTGVITPYWIDRTGFYASAPSYYDWDSLKQIKLDDVKLLNDKIAMAGVSRSLYLADAGTFSVIFSPQGKLVTHRVWIRSVTGDDTIFNVAADVESGDAKFLQDDYGDSPDYGIGPELSVQSFMIYSKKEYRQKAAPWTNYLEKIEPDFINPYTGELVMEYNGVNP